ncbi:ABC transporter permease [Haloarculaceae archaeon H-GB1-1]|nr:ABC transporter permease [Haloarculaceae archaeon H-GB1-1]
MSSEPTNTSVTVTESRVSQTVAAVKALLSTKKGALSIGLLVPIIFGVVAAPFIAPYPPTETHVIDRLTSPSFQYLLGTDQYGRDVFSRILYGGRASLLIGLGSTAFALALGVPIGIVSGYSGGRFDELTMRAMDVLMSIPSLLLALLVVTGLGSGLTNTIIAIGIVFTPRLARITRSSTLSIKNQEYITAAEARGESLFRIAFYEILPNASSSILVEGSIRIGFGILIGSSLSFLGLGTQPPNPDWGYMASVARNHLRSQIWFMLGPGIALGGTILGFNLLGDALRDYLEE